MKTALSLVIGTTTTSPITSRRESLIVTTVEGAHALRVIEELQRTRKTGQVILNFSQGRCSNIQVIEKTCFD